MMEIPLGIVEALECEGILFVPIPVLDDEDKEFLMTLLDTRLLELGAYNDKK